MTTEKQGSKWSRPEKALLWSSGILVILAIVAFLWNNAANNLPTVSIPTPTLPSPNAYDYYVRASKQISGNPLSQSGKPTQAQMKAALPQNLPALATFREGMTHPFLNPPIRSFNVPMTDMASFRELARLLSLEGQVYQAQGNYKGAALAYLDCLRLGQDIPRGGVLIASLVGLACEAIGRRNFWELTEKINTADARTAVKRLEELSAARYPFADTIQEEKWCGQASLLDVLQKNNAWGTVNNLYGSMLPPTTVEYWGTGLMILMRGKKRIFQDYSTFMDSSITYARQPYSPTAQIPTMANDPINSVLLPVLVQAQIKDLDAQMQNALLTAVLALRAYQQEKKDYPTSLDTLVSDGYLTKVPEDPFAGNDPLRYKRVSAKKYVLYSVGPDGKDDGGKPTDAKTSNGTPKRWAEKGMTGDFVARVNTY